MPGFCNKDICTILLLRKECSPVVISSIYAEASLPLQEFFDFIDTILAYCEKEGAEFVLGGDTNSHATLWGYETADSRGNEWEEFLISRGLITLNESEERIDTTEKA